MRQIFASLAVVLLLGFSSNPARGDEAEVTSTPMSVKAEKQGVHLQFTARGGNSIIVDGRPFSLESQFALVSPGWETAYYTYSTDRRRLPRVQRAVQEAAKASGTTPALRLEIPLESNEAAVAITTQTFSILPQRRLQIVLETKPTTATALTMENRLASIPEGWLSNRPFTAQLPDGTTTRGKIFAWSPSSRPSESTVLAGFRRMEIDSPYGPLVIETTGTVPLTLMDYRRSEWADGKRFFWLGVLGTGVPASGHRLDVTFTFPPARADAAAPGRQLDATVMSNLQTYIPPNPADTIVPTPKHLEWKDGNYMLGHKLSIHFPSLDKTTTRTAAAREVVQYYSERWKKKFDLAVTAGGPAMDRSAMSKARIEWVDDWDLADYQADEAYALEVGPPLIQVKVKTADGLRNALATLEQLFRRNSDGEMEVRRATIRDYPAMPFRGIHFFSGHNAEKLQTKMVEEILAPLKINRLVYQVDYVEWETRPEIHSPVYGMKKSEAKAVGDAARRGGIEVIPLLNTFGHCEWLLQRPSMRYLADNPLHPYAYDPSNPEIYRICEAIYNEVIALFQPKIIHIGHDEVTFHDFPFKPENKAVGATKLIIQDIIHYRDFLQKQGIRTMIWGDMFLGPHESPDACLAPTVAEAEHRRGLLPKDIIIADWHYRPADPEKYQSLRKFTDAGFEAVAAAWHQPENIVNFAEQAARERQKTSATLGLLQTTWAGYSFDENSLLSNFDQYAAYVLAAEAAWTGKAAIAEKLDYREWFDRHWKQMPRHAANRNGWQVELNGEADLALNAATADRFSLHPAAFDKLAAGENDWSGYRLSLPAVGERPAAVLTSGTLTVHGINQPGPVNLALATATSLPGNASVGRVGLTLDNGSTVTLELIYGKNIFSIADGHQNLATPAIWKSPNVEENQGQAVIHRTRVDVPSGRKVVSMELTPTQQFTDMLLFGIWGTGREE